MATLRQVCVFCGARAGHAPGYLAAAQRLGRSLARHELGLVYGGGRVGLMGALADAALQAGGRVVGVIPRQLRDRELAHPGLSTLHVVESMHARKALMVELADGFVALPGGFGTLDELFEVLTWGQLGLHDKPVWLVNVGGYFTPLVRFLEHAAAGGLLSPSDLARLRAAPSVAAVVRALGGAAAAPNPRAALSATGVPPSGA